MVQIFYQEQLEDLHRELFLLIYCTVKTVVTGRSRFILSISQKADTRPILVTIVGNIGKKRSFFQK